MTITTATYLDVEQLAEMLGRRPATILRLLRTNPRGLPPRMHFPGSGAKMLRWRPVEVEQWREEQRELDECR